MTEVCREGSDGDCVDIVAGVLAEMFGRRGVSNGMQFRARKIVRTLQKSGHLAGAVELGAADFRDLPKKWSDREL